MKSKGELDHLTEGEVMLNAQNESGAPNKAHEKMTENAAHPKIVADVMIRDIKTLRPDQTFADVVSLLAGNSFHHIIIAVNGYLMGVLSDRDVLRQFSRVGDWTAKKVGEIMTTNSVTVGPQEALSDAADRMLTRRVNCLPVVAQDGKLVGLLTSTDIIRLYKTLQQRVETE
jgi:CBS domain-containing protein